MTGQADASVAQLWLVRHARVLVPHGICYGHLDVPADHQATQTSAHALAMKLPVGLTLSCSTLQRCEQLALAVIALRPDLTLKLDARLCELDFGRWEGQPWQNIDRREIDAWAEDLAHATPGGGETLAHMLKRVSQALTEAQQEHDPARRQQLSRGGPDVVWIAHAGVACCVQWLLSPGARQGRLPVAAEWPMQAPVPGDWACYPLRPAEAG